MFISRWVRCHNNITRRNWAEARPLLLESIRNADFVSFDYELTGLHEKNERYLGVDMAYDAHCQGVKAFLPVQLGICASKYNTDTCEWELTPSSIYLYPWMNGEEENFCFSVSTAALNFLVSNGFDCNEWVMQGLGWLTPSNETEKRRAIQSRLDEILSMKTAAALKPTSSSVFTPMDIPEGPDKESMSTVKVSITEWLKSDPSSVPLELPMESAFTRLLAHTFISHEFPNLFSHSVKRGDARFLCVYKNRSDLFAEQIAALEKEMAKIDEQVGIRELFEEISKSKVPVVGHNCFYDLLHTWHSFFGPIPVEVDAFKLKWMSKFRETFDTKFIADEILGQTAPGTLRALCDSYGSQVRMSVQPLSPNFVYNLPASTSPDLSHDAGYDAMMTSVVFINQIAHLMERKGVAEFPRTNLSSILGSSCNRVRLVKTQPNSLYLAERSR